MSKRVEIATLLTGAHLGQEVLVKGWVRSFRNNQFMILNDGSTFHSIQVVVDHENTDPNILKRITNGAAVCAKGNLVESQGKGQKYEVTATDIEIYGDCDPEQYPLQLKNRPSLEYLREIAHLRFRTNTFGAVFRVRHAMAYAIHKFFNDKGFYYLHTPIITASDAEGAGEMFRVTTIDVRNPQLKNDEIDRWASTFYKEIVKALEEVGEDLAEINMAISKIEKNLTLEGLVTASPSQINIIMKSDSIKQLNKLITNTIYKKIKHKVFKKKDEVTYLPDWLLDLLKQKKKELFIKESKSSLRLSFEKSITKGAGAFSLSFYNIKWISRLNKISSRSELDFSQDFFKHSTNLTVSGQLEAELGAMALGKVYTFGPTFRAENSNTTRHLAEFWMIEPEVAFADLEDNMDLAEGLLKYCIQYALEHCKDDLEFLAQRLADEEKQKSQNERSEMGLIEKLQFCLANDFERLTYTEAVEILKNSKPNQKKQFKYLIEGWGADLQSEHERYLVEKHFKKPVILTDYPKDIKAFYMRQNEDGKTVRAMDILFPGIGEIVGGSQREERLDKLTTRMQEMHIPTEELDWYLDTRRYGACPHAGFGLGFERMILFVTGMTNIRDVIAFPRFPGNAKF